MKKELMQIYHNFRAYIKDAQNIFDIMAGAYKALYPFEPMVPIEQDSALRDLISCFAEQYNTLRAFDELKDELQKWLLTQQGKNSAEFQKKLFFLIRLIDGKCAHIEKSSLPDSYVRYFSLNRLFQDEICILPHYQNGLTDLLSESIKEKSGYGFYGRNYSRTSDISGYLNNYTIYRKIRISPCMVVPNYYQEILQEFDRKNRKLKVGIFPLSDLNLNRIFRIKEEISDKEGLFYIESAQDGQEEEIFVRCKAALNICKDQQVDIVVFPEMLFTPKNQHAIIDFIKENDSSDEERHFPWFTWLGTSWAQRENKCIVVDQYGKIVLEQNKYVPYEYRKGMKDKIVIREALSHEKSWIVNFLDLPDFMRIATAICRDISDDYLTAVLKELYSDLVIIPAFSGSDRLNGRSINSLTLEKIISLVCNACSALCKESQERLDVNAELVGNEQIFSYLCLPAKQANDNVPDYHMACYTSGCLECKKCCRGYIWEIDFTECTVKEGQYSARVI